MLLEIKHYAVDTIDKHSFKKPVYDKSIFINRNLQSEELAKKQKNIQFNLSLKILRLHLQAVIQIFSFGQNLDTNKK